jgi:starvation-inducible DNA-binding protein
MSTDAVIATSTIPSSPTIPSTLDDTARDDVAARLQPCLVDLIDLTLTAKQLHWTVVGRNFSSLHLQLDTVTTAYRTWSDQVAERMATIGVTPDGRSQRVADDAAAPPAPEGWVGERAAVEDMVVRLSRAVSRMREQLDGIGEHDPVSEDLLIGVLAGLEEQHWMFAAQLVDT